MGISLPPSRDANQNRASLKWFSTIFRLPRSHDQCEVLAYVSTGYANPGTVAVPRCFLLEAAQRRRHACSGLVLLFSFISPARLTALAAKTKVHRCSASCWRRALDPESHLPPASVNN